MEAVAVALIWAGVAVYGISRWADVVEQFAPMAHTPPPAEMIDVPDDLIALASEERETWAQEETLRAMRERYELSGDWNVVRSAFGIGRRD